ncbi:uncharacterized protein IL334_002303 [Kwoniella shivajii]|uniref:Uncharacterized protein n=1 Tax=Kwoniella shivajii TaxID=564305 RepID=A0ABZ1CVZ2_9TREE|nr:hypothetical protein IL334_002303 [Kwoniella shivajii]
MPAQSTSSTPVPGAALPPSSKPKKNKKKANLKTEDVPSNQKVETDAEPILSQVQEEIVPPSVTESGKKQKGPVEEVIAKRMRQLMKKIQRFRGYASQPHEQLNADQRAGISSLPILENLHKELEELSKQVEPVELEQAGKIREIKQQATKEAENNVSEKITEFQYSLSTPLALFLRLHKLLHPARSSDHDHLTFARLDLPLNLQDAVQATDVLRIGRMYEELIAGGESGKEIIAGLVKGSTGDDEENDQIHHLLSLLAAPSDPEAETAPEEVDLEESQSAPQVDEPVSNAPSESELPNGDVKEEEAELEEVAPAPNATLSGQGGLNFLQEDELAEEEAAINETPVAAAPEPMATSPSPPIESAPASSAPIPAAVPAHFDWAADEDLDEEAEAAHIRQAFALPPSGTQTPAIPQGRVEEQTVEDEREEPAIALIQENELANAHVSPSAIDVPTAVESDAVPAPSSTETKDVTTQPKRHRARGGKQNPNRAQQSQQQGGPAQAQGGQIQGQRQEQSQGQGSKPSAKPTIDEDGFIVVGRQAPPVNRGRGGSNGSGRGRGDGARGRGQAGRGRGGPGPRGGSRPVPSSESPGQQTGGNRPAKQNRQSSVAQAQATAPAAA